MRGALLAAVLLASSAFAEVEFYQQVDRNKVGTEDTFHLTIVVGDAPDNATVQLPASPDTEVLSQSQSTQMTYQMGSSGTGIIKRVQRYTLVMRANRTGTIKIPGAVLATGAKNYKTEPITIEAVKGRLTPEPQQQQRQPPGFPPGFPNFFGGDEDPFGIGPEPEIPRSDSDLFMRMSLDKESAYVGEQVTLSVTIYSRVDLA